MAISNYSELKTAVANWLNRSNLTDRIPEFISLAEAEINRDTKLRPQEVLATSTYDNTVTSRFVTLPSNYLRLYGIQLKESSEDNSRYEPLLYVNPELMWRYVRETTGRPYRYTIRGYIEYESIPDKSYTVRMHYLKRWDIANDGINDLLTHHPDVYLWGALKHAMVFVHTDPANQKVTGFDKWFQRAIEEADLLHHKTRDDATLDTAEVSGMGYGSGSDTFDGTYDIVGDR